MCVLVFFVALKNPPGKKDTMQSEFIFCRADLLVVALTPVPVQPQLARPSGSCRRAGFSGHSFAPRPDPISAAADSRFAAIESASGLAIDSADCEMLGHRVVDAKRLTNSIGPLVQPTLLAAHSVLRNSRRLINAHRFEPGMT